MSFRPTRTPQIFDVSSVDDWAIVFKFLLLATVDVSALLKGGTSGLKAVVPGHPEKSFLIEAVRGEPDPEVQMPPKGEPLAPDDL